MIAALECGRLIIVKQATFLITSLVLGLATHDVENECVTRYLLIRLDLDNVSSLYAAPITDLETLVPLGKDKLLDGLRVDFLSRLFQLLVM